MRGLIDPGPDLVRHQLHRAPGERWIGPVVARVEQCAERADLVAECKNLVCDALGGSRDYETLDAPLRGEFGIRLVSEHDRFAILAENVPIETGQRVDGLDEESELQGVLH